MNSKTGALQVNSEIDVDIPSSIFKNGKPSTRFNVTCQTGKENFVMSGKVNFTDVNDNAPTTTSKKSREHLVYYLTPVSYFQYNVLIKYNINLFNFKRRIPRL